MAVNSNVIPLSRSERSKLDKYERIKRAARELFRRKGFHETTTSEIAELADVAKGTVFFHAGTKESLLVMFFQEEVGHSVNRAFATAPKASLLDQAMHVFTVMLEHMERDLELARVFMKEVAFLTDDRHRVDEVTAGFFRKMSELIEQAQEKGEIRKDISPPLLAYNLFALYFAFQLLWLRGGEPSWKSATPSLREILELHLMGLRDSGDKRPGFSTARRLGKASR
ncbi:MAG: TetR/AcrR family transcriptional regulator [Candidatus Binatus sp.]|uniref:TetR/AcrR family transcriptional regulator n=1 Tax=Candidatus Binatus sp. TaxID=2811406 RepID=UPI0027281CB8|nr:TetR/AcrR family transcriptional regulator [Candidatus Binatus sp.]MDO8430887.1 TetR/AcrR family transcriptional regulator [Candidatus Binatus sp.]